MMATNNRGGNRGRTGRNNNPEGHNQYTGIVGSARSNPVAAAAAVGGAVAAGVFLWSRRNQISDQIGNLSDQLSELRQGRESGDSYGTARSSGRSQTEIAEEALRLKEAGQNA